LQNKQEIYNINKRLIASSRQLFFALSFRPRRDEGASESGIIQVLHNGA